GAASASTHSRSRSFEGGQVQRSPADDQCSVWYDRHRQGSAAATCSGSRRTRGAPCLRESLQGGVVSQETSRLFHWAKTSRSLVLGLLMLTFGFLKVVNPTIDGWFHVQIQQSHLPHSAILMGKFAEIMTGALFLLPRFRPMPAKWEGRILLIACSSL